MYSANARVEAYTHFLLGDSFEVIADKLKKSYKKISHVTIREWATSENWELKRSIVIKSSIERVESKARDILTTQLDKGTLLEKKLFDSLISETVGLKSTEGGVYAWTALSKFNREVHEKLNSESSPLLVIQLFMEVLNSVPSVKKVIEKNWSKIDKLLNVKLLGEPPK